MTLPPYRLMLNQSAMGCSTHDVNTGKEFIYGIAIWLIQIVSIYKEFRQRKEKKILRQQFTILQRLVFFSYYTTLSRDVRQYSYFSFGIFVSLNMTSIWKVVASIWPGTVHLSFAKAKSTPKCCWFLVKE